ncbi:phage tail assembly protein [Paracoccus sp. KR1-242]|uniref:phage tail assembly protein n=1 Tax=Paracoccus sp. KR1-242 TaxID=3410028 RepID=UPI003C0FF380
MDPVILQYPVTIEGHPETITQLTFRRRKARDVRRVRQGENDFERGLIALSCSTDLPLEVIEELDEDDLTIAMERLSDFFEETASPPNT